MRIQLREVFSVVVAVTGLASATLLISPSRVDAAEPIRFDILVAKVASGEASIDPAGAALHEKLKEQFRYDRLEVKLTRTLSLSIDEVGRVDLPNDRQLLVKPLVLDERGALVAIDISGLLQTDLKMRSDHIVVIGAESFEDGKLVVSLEPHFETP